MLYASRLAFCLFRDRLNVFHRPFSLHSVLEDDNILFTSNLAQALRKRKLQMLNSPFIENMSQRELTKLSIKLTLKSQPPHTKSSVCYLGRVMRVRAFMSTYVYLTSDREISFRRLINRFFEQRSIIRYKTKGLVLHDQLNSTIFNLVGLKFIYLN